MRTPRWALLALLAAAACGQEAGAPILGTVNVAPPLLSRFEKPNTMLLIVARDAGGVPVALRRIVNPRFPCPFELGPENLLLPGGWKGPLTIEADLSSHSGPDGLPAPEAEARDRQVRTGDADVRLFVSAPASAGWASAKMPSERPYSDQ